MPTEVGDGIFEALDIILLHTRTFYVLLFRDPVPAQ
jgi:hypothetical protein